MTTIYLLIRWDDRSDEVISAHAELGKAFTAYLDECYPLQGPRGGKRPQRPLINWSEDKHRAGHWTPEQEGQSPEAWSGYYVEQHEVQP
jgi:hypothetical protein